jgi:hypothetical protein
MVDHFVFVLRLSFPATAVDEEPESIAWNDEALKKKEDKRDCGMILNRMGRHTSRLRERKKLIQTIPRSVKRNFKLGSQTSCKSIDIKNIWW